jgi:pyrroline-5-carboxylate reductase
MIRGLLEQNLLPAKAITASGPRPARGQYLRKQYGINWTEDNAECTSGKDIVVLAVKPQVLPHVLPELAGRIVADTMVMSIVAGTLIRTIAQGLGHDAIVRVMPNTPARLAQGISVWMATDAVTARQRDQARTVLQALGEELSVDDEDYLDMATALSGTGPAYVFLFMEAMVDAGVHMGFSRRVAERLVEQTVLGAAAFAKQSPRHLAELRNMVTSPGGTSAEALYQLEKGGLRTVISRAIWAAYKKSKYLGGLSES